MRREITAFGRAEVGHILFISPRSRRRQDDKAAKTITGAPTDPVNHRMSAHTHHPMFFQLLFEKTRKSSFSAQEWSDPPVPSDLTITEAGHVSSTFDVLPACFYYRSA